MIDKKAIAIIVVALLCSAGIFVYALSPSNHHDDGKTHDDSGKEEVKMATITFDMNGGVGTQIEPIKTPLNTSVKMPELDWTKDGYLMGNVVCSGATLKNGSIVPTSEQVVVKADWVKADMITYDYGSGEISKKDVKLEGSIFKLMECPVEKEGFTFFCWKDKSTDELYTAGSEICLTNGDRMNLVAVWI